MSPTEYEKAVMERFRTDWPPPEYQVVHNIRLPGSKTKVRRQIDVSVFETGNPKPFLIIEAKRRGRAIDAGIAGTTIALIQDVGRIPAIMVSTSGFSVAASNHLDAEDIGYLIITLKEAQGLRWLPMLSTKFSVDREFRHISGDLAEALRRGDVEPFLNTEIPYDEWLAIFECGQSSWPTKTTMVLKALAREHFDDGVRFNVALLLEDAGQLNRADLKAILDRETDPDARDTLMEMGGL